MSVTERSLRPVSLPRLRAVLPHRRPAPLYETVIVEPEETTPTVIFEEPETPDEKSSEEE